MPGPRDLRTFVPGQPLQDYLSARHLNAVLEAMGHLNARHSDWSSGVYSAIGHLRAAAPELLDRDIVIYNNTAVDPVGVIDGEWIDLPKDYYKFDLVPLGPPEGDPFDETFGEQVASGNIVYSAFSYDQASDENVITYAIALHNTPSCTIGLALVAGNGTILSDEANDSTLAQFSVSRQGDVGRHDHGFSIQSLTVDARLKHKTFATEILDYPSGETAFSGGGNCHYTCAIDPQTPDGGLRWVPLMGSCAPNTYCIPLGSCTVSNATTQAPCVASDFYQKNPVRLHMEGSDVQQFSFDNLTKCTDKYTGEWEWIHIGEQCTKTGCVVNMDYLPECTEGLCGKWRRITCSCPSTTSTTTTTTTSTTTTSSTTTTPCPVDPRSGRCGCASYECVDDASGSSYWKRTANIDSGGNWACCCDDSSPGPCSLGDTQILPCFDQTVGCSESKCEKAFYAGCRQLSPFAPPPNDYSWPVVPCGMRPTNTCCSGGCGGGGWLYRQGRVDPLNGCFPTYYSSVGCGAITSGTSGVSRYSPDYYVPTFFSASGRVCLWSYEQLYDARDDGCGNPCGEGASVLFPHINWPFAFCIYYWKDGGWRLKDSLYSEYGPSYSKFGDACGSVSGQHCLPPPDPDYPPTNGTINWGVCCRASTTTTTSTTPDPSSTTTTSTTVPPTTSTTTTTTTTSTTPDPSSTSSTTTTSTTPDPSSSPEPTTTTTTNEPSSSPDPP